MFSFITGLRKESQPPQEELSFIRKRFFTEKKDITDDDKRILAELSSKSEFRTFERYIDWRVNAAAHRMKQFLLDGKMHDATIAAADIDSLGRIGADMKSFWNEVRSKDVKEGLDVGEKQIRDIKAFGNDRYALANDFLDPDEAERV